MKHDDKTNPCRARVAAVLLGAGLMVMAGYGVAQMQPPPQALTPAQVNQVNQAAGAATARAAQQHAAASAGNAARRLNDDATDSAQAESEPAICGWLPFLC